MDQIFIRNFAIFMLLLLLCAGSLSYSLIAGDKDLSQTDDLVLHTYDVINEAEQLSTMIEGLLAAQRGYLLTADEKFLARYEQKKANVSDHIATLSELVMDNPSQQSRLDEIRNYFNDFSSQLEQRAEVVQQTQNNIILQDIEAIDNIKNNILRINSALLNEEHALLSERFTNLENQKTQYFTTLLISVAVGTLLLLILNAFLLRVQRKRNRAEADLKETEERFALAIDGTQDGIFDWNIKTGEIFYSSRFFQMLGYDKKAFTGTAEDSLNLIHPEQKTQVWNHVQQYINGELSEYHQEFRMKHASGRWMWIQSRAKALFDKNGKAYRMVGAHTDITHIVKAKEKLEAEKQEAEEANRAKSDFLAHMSHEIRTPLTAISGIAEIFERNQKNFSDKQKKLLNTLVSSTASLKDLINDILDFSKIENRELELDEENFFLDELFENIISMMAMKASEKGISFVFDYDALRNYEFYGDPARLRQILVNLISNAIKFTDEGGVTVQTSIEKRDDSNFLRIDVADTGIGIDPENFDLVFERFKQADSSVSRKYGGTGLGLPISRNLAQLMGGDLFLSSQSGKGSTFTLLIPLKLSNSKAGKVKKHSGKKLNEKIQSTISDEHKILIVEDYEGNIVVIGHILEEIGAKYDVAKTGLEAVNLWQNNHYDIILMDIQMPEMDGFTATKEIRKKESQSNLEATPIIGMTAHALVGDKDKCIKAGMDAYLPKPIVESDLKRQILKFLQKQKEAA